MRGDMWHKKCISAGWLMWEPNVVQDASMLLFISTWAREDTEATGDCG